LPIPLLLLILDATFNLYFWRIPKLSGPGGDWGYQFLIDLHRAEEPKPSGVQRVVAFGSSVSCSFDPWQVEGLLAASTTTPPTEVHRLMLPGVHPADYRLFWEDEAQRVQPDVAVIMVNLIDFLTSSNVKNMNPTLLAALPPWRVLAEHGERLSATEKLDWAARGVSRLYRYSKAARSSVQDHARFGLQWLRRRTPPRAYGIYADGFTKPRFGLSLTAAVATEIEYEIDPAWIAQRGVVELSFSAGGKVLRRVREVEAGWKRVQIEIPPGAAPRVDVAANGFWNRRAAGEGGDTRLLGVRLREAPAGDLEAVPPPLAYPPHAPTEVHELLRMDGALGEAFERRWAEVLNARNEFGRRLRDARDDKLRIREQAFSESAEYAELARLVEDLSARGIAVLIVNTPESPWVLEGYQDTEYYRHYLEFLSRLAAQNRKVRFTDLRDALPVEDFNDWHHPNYIGTIKLGPRYAEAVRELIDGGTRH